MAKLARKVALITGASSGIGEAGSCKTAKPFIQPKKIIEVYTQLSSNFVSSFKFRVYSCHGGYKK